MKIKITKSRVDKIPLPDKGQKYFWDTDKKGFGLCVGKTKKTYIVQKRIHGKPVRFAIGEHGHITAEDARKKAETLLGEMTAGKNPVDERKAERARSLTLTEALEDFLESRSNLKPRTIHDYRYHVDKHFSGWRKKPLVEITKDMVERRHKLIREKGGEAQANLAMRYLRALFNYAGAKYENAKGASLIPENPVNRLSQIKAWYRVERRRTVIKVHELPALFDALDKLKDTATTSKAEIVRDYVLFLLFTGLRRQEAAKLEWEQIDFKDKTFTILDTKNRQTLTLPLSDFLHELLTARHENKLNDYVFSGNGAGGYLVEPKRQLAKIREYSGLTFSLHDLRRTFITIAESLDIPHYALKRLVNHKMSGDVTAGYIVHDAERLRAPMQKITDKILTEAGRKEQARVISLGLKRKAEA